MKLSRLHEHIALAGCMALAAVALALVWAPAAHAQGAYEIESSADLVYFAEEVNEGRSFSGVTVELSNNLNLGSVSGSLTPIGTKEHPFRGCFDGKGHTLRNFTVEGSQYVGLFGYVGEGGQIKDLKIGSGVSIQASSSSEVVKCVGSLAGYVYGVVGEGGAAIDGCSSSATVTVSSTMDATSVDAAQLKGPEDDLGGLTDNGSTIEYIGGLVGYSAGIIANCGFSGELSVTTHEGAYVNNAFIARNIGGVAGGVGGYVVDHVAARTSYEPFYPVGGGAYANTASMRSVYHCQNSGTLSIVVDGDNGLDRFGEVQLANAMAVGGVVGYSMANVARCTNTGTIDGPTSDGTGGVVGIVRGYPISGMSAAASDAGCFKPQGAPEDERLEGPQLTVSECVNDARILGLHGTGGVVGCAGTYTRITACANKWTSGTQPGVTVTRWNKPKCGGIAGQSFGKVDHCYNRADCVSKTGAGYYIAGVVGALERWEKVKNADCTSEFPEIVACYTTGSVEKGGGLYCGALCGDNYGIVHDSFYLRGKAMQDRAVGKDQAITKDTAKVLKEASELKTKESVAALNGPNSVSDYRNSRMFVPDSNASPLNDGYPVLAFERDGDSGKTELTEAGLSFGAAGTAKYSAAENPAPALEATLSGTALVQGADYYALPDAAAANATGGCKDVADLTGATLHATVVGMGDYTTSASTGVGSAPYSVVKGSFEDCSATIDAVTFNFLEQSPSADSVSVVDAAGNEVPKGTYTFKPRDESQEHVNHYVTRSFESPDNREHEGYVYEFIPLASSNYDSKTKTYGFFNIKKVDITDIDLAAYDGLEFNGTTWKWHMGDVSTGAYVVGYLYRMVDGAEVPGMRVVYTGGEIRPKVLPVKIQDGNGQWRTLVQGSDYRVLYGDPGEASTTMSKDSDVPNTNVTSEEIGKRACVTIGSYPGNAQNFDNYQNIFFDIVQADISKDCTVSVPSSVCAIPGKVDVKVKGYTGVTIPAANYTVTTKKLDSTKLQVTVTGKKNLKGAVTKNVTLTKAPLAKAKVTLKSTSLVYTGKALKPAVASVVYAGVKLTKGTDYTVSYKNNKKVGKATVTVAGTGRCAGSVKATFKIVPKATKLKKLKKGKKRFTATWVKQAKETTGYELRYSLKKNMKSAKTVTVKKAKTTKTTVKKLKAKKTYYVQVRTYKKVGSTKYCSAWSAKMKVKTK